MATFENRLYSAVRTGQQLRANDYVFTVSVSSVYGNFPLANFQNMAKSYLKVYIFIVISSNGKYARLNNTEGTPTNTVVCS